MTKTRTAYQFQDPATGLFWTGNLKPARGTMFDDKGVEVREERSANALWRQYEAMRRIDPAGKELPLLERVEYHVTMDVTARESFKQDDRFMAEILFSRLIPHGQVVKFVRQIMHRSDWQDFPFMVETVSGGPKARLHDLIEALNDPLVSSRKSSHRLIAVRSEAEMLFCKIQLGDQYRHAWEVATARKII